MLKNTKTKKVFAALVAFTFALSLIGGLTPSAHADVIVDASVLAQFNRDLTLGSTGSDVAALQTILVNNGFLVMPVGVAQGYFGNLTKAALGAMQASVGISPAAGYFGPITRAYLNTHAGASTVPGCTSTSGFSSTTGAPCNGGSTSTVPGCTGTTGFSSTTGQSCAGGVASTVPGCTSTIGFSPTTGQPCNGGTPPVSTTGEGTLTVTQGTPGSNSNIQTSVDTPVYGLQLRAQLGDVRVDRIDLDVSDTINGVTNTTENPGNFISNIKVWDGSTVLLNRSLSSADFITGTSSTDYYVRLSGLNFLVPNGSTKTLTVSFSTSGSIDTNRTLVIRGFGTASLLAYSGVNNTASYYDISTITTTQIFQKPGNSTVIFGVDASNPLSKTNYVDVNNGSQLVPLLVFNSNTTQGTATLTQVVAQIRSGTSSFPTGAHLFQGTTDLQYQAVTAAGTQTITFNNLNLANTTGGNVYTIKVDMPASTNNGSTASATVSSIVYQNTNGNQQTSTVTISGNNQYFYHVTPQFAFTSADYVKTNNTSGQTISVQANFHFTETPFPGQAFIPTANDFVVVAKNSSTGTTTTLTSKGITITPQPTGFLSANQAYSIVLSATDAAQAPGVTVVYYLTSASSTIQDGNGNMVNVTQTWGLDNYHTDPVSKT